MITANFLNAIRSNVWCVVLIFLGAALLAYGNSEEERAAGTALVTGSFAIFKQSEGIPMAIPPKEPG